MSEASKLFVAIGEGDLETLTRVLGRNPGLLREPDERGLTPIMVAAYHHEKEVLAELLARTSELDPFEAATVGDHERLRTHLDGDPELVRRYSPDGVTLLHLAAYFGHPEVVRLLTERGADANARSSNGMDNTPLHAGVAGALEMEGVRILLNAGADAGARQQGGYTALHAAAQRADAAMVSLLLERGADRTAAADDGRTAADFAHAGGRAEVLALLGASAPA